MLICEGLPRHVGIGLTVIQDIHDMHQKREIPQIHQTKFRLATDSLTHYTGNDKAF